MATPQQVRRRGRFGLLVGTVVAALMMVAVAHGDQVKNSLTAVAGKKTVTVTQPSSGSTTVDVEYELEGTGSGGCNVTIEHPGTLSFGTLPTGVSITAGQTWTSCGNQNVTFSISSAASTTSGDGHHLVPVMSGGRADGNGWNYVNADFYLKIEAATAPSDTTPPTVTVTAPPVPDGQGGWFNASNVPVTIQVSASDDSGVTDISCTVGSSPVTVGAQVGSNPRTGSFSLSDDGTHNISCEATDGASPANTGAAAGSANTAQVKIDKTPPTVTCDLPAPSFLLNQSPANVTATATDAGSGPASPNVSAAADTSSVGSKTVQVNASDVAGNPGSATCSYTVGYKFVGFDRPVENGSILNRAKAGQAIPLKWQLLDANDTPVTSLSSVGVTVAPLSCDLGQTEDAVEEYAAGSSGLQNLGGGFYQFNWKTPTNYANSCKTLHLNLGEGSTRSALFRFVK